MFGHIVPLIGKEHGGGWRGQASMNPEEKGPGGARGTGDCTTVTKAIFVIVRTWQRNSKLIHGIAQIVGSITSSLR